MPTSRPPATVWPASLAVARKELRESFRDRQTLMYSVVLPICLYPVIFWLLIQGTLLVQGQREHTRVRVGLALPSDEAAPAGLADALRRPPAEAAAPGPLGRDLHPVEVEELAWDGGAPPAAGLDGFGGAERPDAVLRIGATEGAPAALYYDSTESRSSIARRRVEERLRAFAEDVRHRAADEAGVDPRVLDPFELESRNVAASEDMGAYVLSFMLPMLFVVMAVMGAFFPAVDLTAGERERGTAETTLLLPVPRLAVHQGKILAVCASAMLATGLNLFALALSAEHLLEMLSAGEDIRIELPLTAFVAVAPLTLLFAFSVSAVLTGCAALARTFKEGQALIGPVQMIFILPAMAGALPGLELTPASALVPIVNVVLAFRSLLRGEVLPLELALTAASLLAFAVLAIYLAVRVLSREEIQASSRTVSLGRLATLLRSPAGTR